MYFNPEECATILAHYDFDTRNPEYCYPGKTIGTYKYSDEQLLAITNRIVNQMGLDWLRLVWDREEVAKIKSKINSYDANWINSPYHELRTPRIPLPENHQEIVSKLQQKLSTLETRIAQRTQKVGRGTRRMQTYKKTVNA